MNVKSTLETRQDLDTVSGSFDADRLAYDVDTKTGLFYAVTFSRIYQRGYTNPVMTHVPFSEEVLALVPEGKREIYLEKFGRPVTEETQEQKMDRLLEAVAELTNRLPVPHQPKKPAATNSTVKVLGIRKL